MQDRHPPFRGAVAKTLLALAKVESQAGDLHDVVRSAIIHERYIGIVRVLDGDIPSGSVGRKNEPSGFSGGIFDGQHFDAPMSLDVAVESVTTLVARSMVGGCGPMAFSRRGKSSGKKVRRRGRLLLVLQQPPRL